MDTPPQKHSNILARSLLDQQSTKARQVLLPSGPISQTAVHPRKTVPVG